jgi:hypothetical protein
MNRDTYRWVQETLEFSGSIPTNPGHELVYLCTRHTKSREYESQMRGEGESKCTAKRPLVIASVRKCFHPGEYNSWSDCGGLHRAQFWTVLADVVVFSPAFPLFLSSQIHEQWR